jgi:hypothetical protein
MTPRFRGPRAADPLTAEATAGEAELRTALLERIAKRTDASLGDGEFDRLARAIFAHQFRCNSPYRSFCERRGSSPASISHWTEIPAVPVDAFRAVPLVCGDPADAAVVFRTSGTTGGARRGEHHLPELGLYDAALAAGFAAHLLPDGARTTIVSLIPSPQTQPDSSLSHMAGETVRRFGAPASGFFVEGDGIETDRLTGGLRRAEESGDPLCLLGTAFAFVHWLDALQRSGERFRLPAGSRLMETGGFKGRSREVPRAELYGAFAEWLGIAPEWCVNEYGMTEMSSQFYDAAAGDSAAAELADRLHRGPPWVRTRAVDPETLEPLPDGETGVLRHWDLANLHTVAVLQTADLGVTYPGGFRLLGRAPAAEARGCSIAMDELLAALGR